MKATDFSLMLSPPGICGLFNEANSCKHETPYRGTFGQSIFLGAPSVSLRTVQNPNLFNQITLPLPSHSPCLKSACTSSNVSPIPTQLCLYFLSQTLPLINVILRWLILSWHLALCTCSHNTDINVSSNFKSLSNFYTSPI